ncbi:MAG TPA: hypothetical protein VFD13_03030 [Candidatus Kapabacteria bacterium]|nr:hypothetical protein [Candidatus Kapabacteria bacterium]
MNKIKTFAVLSFIALLSYGIVSCRTVTGPGTGGDTVRHPLDTVHHPVDTTHFRDTTIVPDTFRFHRHPDHDFDSLNHRDTLIHRDTIIHPPIDTVRDSNNGGLDSTLLDSLLHH